MKVRSTRGMKALVIISIGITLISLLVIGTVIYSTYSDYKQVQGEFAGSSAPRPVVTRSTQGTTETVVLNITIPNRGLYALAFSLSCAKADPNIHCDASSVTVSAGQEKSMAFRMTIDNYAQYSSGGLHINATVGVELPPFVSLKVSTDFGSLARSG